MGARGLTISFTQAALFPSGEDLIAEDTYPSILKIATAIQQIPNPVRLEGHSADTAPVEDNQTEAGRKRNRRVDIIILNETGVKGEPERPPPVAPAAPAESSRL